VSDLLSGSDIRYRVKIIQQKTGKSVPFEITKQTSDALQNWINAKNHRTYDWVFPSRKDINRKMTTRQYGRIVKGWVESIVVPQSSYGTHSLCRTKATVIYRKTGNLRAVQLLLGHTKIDSTDKYLGVEVEDALAFSESIEV